VPFVVATYGDLQQHVEAFHLGHLRSLLLLGPPGVGKSQIVRRVLGAQAAWIAGNATPFGIYLHAYEHRDEPLVLDDIDDLGAQPAGARLLKALCQSDDVRTLSWQSAAHALRERGVPREFPTSSPVMLIANQWTTSSLNVQAVEDRLHVLSFQPSQTEIHRQAATWFWDAEVFEFVGRHLNLLADLSFRVYIRAAELKQAGLDWRSAVLVTCVSPTTAIVARLKADDTLPSEEARAQAFVQGGHGCRATYFNHVRKLPTVGAGPDLPLKLPTALAASDSPPDESLPPLESISGDSFCEVFRHCIAIP